MLKTSHGISQAEDAALQDPELMRGVSAADGTSKARIERAAVTLFASGGIDGTSTKDIAAMAGLSEGVIYRHFRSKAELARSLMETEHTRLAAMIRSAEQSSGSLADKVEQIVENYCAAAGDDWALFTYYLLHYHRFATLGTRETTVQDSPQRAAVDIVKAAQASGDIPKGDAHLRASMALGVVLQAATAKLYGHINLALSRKSPLLQSAVLAVLTSSR